ncbi:hypothetical protein C7212DRAFT_165221, partial [Tuber magnatum]
GLKGCRRPRIERRTPEICITCKHLVRRQRLHTQHERIPIASRLLWSLVYKVSCAELHNCRPSHRLLDGDISLPLLNR